MTNYGFIKPTIQSDHYLGGALPKVVLQADGNWLPYLPLYERQFGDNFDTYGCTVFGTLNCLETIFKKIYGNGWDYSERYIYNLAEIEPPGADPHLIAETIRKQGVIEQKELPMTNTLEDFKKPRPMSKGQIDKGHLWLARYSFGHEWVFDEDEKDISKKHELIREYLKYSPLGISVSAWQQDDQDEYIFQGQNNHWCMAIKIDEKDRVYVFDSYDQEVKILSPEHNIQFCKRYYIIEKSPTEQLNNARLNFIQIILSYVKKLISASGELLAGIFSKRN